MLILLNNLIKVSTTNGKRSCLPMHQPAGALQYGNHVLEYFIAGSTYENFPVHKAG
jgi:hypothetical protein